MNTIHLANSSITLRLDLAEWMRSTGRFDSIKATDREWIAATCPYHDDRTPSFAVNVDNGNYVCSACGAHGTFVSLVRHVENHDTAYDAELSLIARFGSYVPATDEPLNLDFGDVEEETFVEAPIISQGPTGRYLDEQRGITQETQNRFHASYDLSKKAIMLPWFDAKGRCVTVKHRSVEGKSFWYEPRISPGRLRRLLYGLHLAKDAKMIVVCEGEIDAMSVVQAGFAAVALGGTNVSSHQIDILRNHGCDEVVIFVDNEAVDTLVEVRKGVWEPASRKAKRALIDGLVGHKRVSVVDWSMAPNDKDANDVLRGWGESAIRTMIEHRINESVPLSFGE